MIHTSLFCLNVGNCPYAISVLGSTLVFKPLVIISLKVYSHISQYVPVTDMEKNVEYNLDLSLKSSSSWEQCNMEISGATWN